MCRISLLSRSFGSLSLQRKHEFFKLRLKNGVANCTWVSPVKPPFGSTRLFGWKTAVFAGRLRIKVENAIEPTATIPESTVEKTVDEIDAIVKLSNLDPRHVGHKLNIMKALHSNSRNSPTVGFQLAQFCGSLVHQFARQLSTSRAVEVLVTKGKPSPSLIPKLPFAKLLRVMRDVIRQIWAAWSLSGIHHRDLNFGNIVVKPEACDPRLDTKILRFLSRTRPLPPG